MSYRSIPRPRQCPTPIATGTVEQFQVVAKIMSSGIFAADNSMDAQAYRRWLWENIQAKTAVYSALVAVAKQAAGTGLPFSARGKHAQVLANAVGYVIKTGY